MDVADSKLQGFQYSPCHYSSSRYDEWAQVFNYTNPQHLLGIFPPCWDLSSLSLCNLLLSNPTSSNMYPAADSVNASRSRDTGQKWEPKQEHAFWVFSFFCDTEEILVAYILMAKVKVVSITCTSQYVSLFLYYRKHFDMRVKRQRRAKQKIKRRL